MQFIISVCQLLMQSARVARFLGEVKFALISSLFGAWMLLAPSLKITLRYLLMSCNIRTRSSTLASTSPYYPLTTHHSFSSSLSKICFISYLCFCRLSLEPLLKQGVRLSNCGMVYLPGGNNRFSRLFDKASALLFYMIQIIKLSLQTLYHIKYSFLRQIYLQIQLHRQLNILQWHTQFIISFHLTMRVEDVSSEDINIKTTDKKRKEGLNLNTLGINAINELELSVNMTNTEDIQQLSKILVEILSYPNEDIAKIHSESMRLGNFDLEKPVKDSRIDTSTSLMQLNVAQKICPCCGFIKQERTISACTNFDEIKNMGVSTYLYFSTYKNLAILLSIMFIIYSVFAIITNVIASNNYNSMMNAVKKVDYIAISLSSKQTNDTTQNRLYYFIQCWLGLGTIIIWIFVLIAMKFFEIKNIQQYDDDTISCSDYSVVMEGMPLDVKKEQLQKQLNVYYQHVSKSVNIPKKWKKPFSAVKVNVGKPFYLHQESFKDEQLDSIEKELTQTKQKIIDLVIERKKSSTFSLPKEQRSTLYENYAKLTKRKAERYAQFTKKIRESLKEQATDQTTTAFVTFQTNFEKSLMSYLHEVSIITRIRSIFGQNDDRFSYQKEGRIYSLEIRRAPEPQDIIWTNLGQKNCSTYVKKLFTFTITIILLGICFAIVYGLTILQQGQEDNRLISIAISVTISVVNMILGQVIRRLTIIEKDYTETYHQASLAIKSIIAQMVNTILIPIITAYYIKNNIYQTSGLVDTIFMLSISISIVPPIMLFINPYNFFVKLMRCIKSTPASRLQQNQKAYNILQEGLDFEVGFQSIYSINLFMFVCFFVSLQPIIPVIALIGYFLMYWVEKYSLFNVYKRPVPGTEFVNDAIFRIVRLGPLVYSFGSLTWSNLSPNGIPPQALIPNLICIGFSVILFLLPINTILIGTCFQDQIQKPTTFQQCRIFLPSQYDRLNPTTTEQGLEDYKKYMERKRDQFKNLSKEKQAQIEKKMMINAQRGQMINNGMQNRQNMGNFMPGFSNFSFPQPQPYYMNNVNQSGYMMPMMPFMPFSSGAPTQYGFGQPQMIQQPQMRPPMQPVYQVPQNQSAINHQVQRQPSFIPPPQVQPTILNQIPIQQSRPAYNQPQPYNLIHPQPQVFTQPQSINSTQNQQQFNLNTNPLNTLFSNPSINGLNMMNGQGQGQRGW